MVCVLTAITVTSLLATQTTDSLRALPPRFPVNTLGTAYPPAIPLEGRRIDNSEWFPTHLEAILAEPNALSLNEGEIDTLSGLTPLDKSKLKAVIKGTLLHCLMTSGTERYPTTFKPHSALSIDNILSEHGWEAGAYRGFFLSNAHLRALSEAFQDKGISSTSEDWVFSYVHNENAVQDAVPAIRTEYTNPTNLKDGAVIGISNFGVVNAVKQREYSDSMFHPREE